MPDDWHLHLRDGAMLRLVAPLSALHFRRALVMPNLNPPITTVEQALAYRKRILEAIPEGSPFEPYLTLYLTETTRPEEVQKAAREPYILGFKLYPAGATTHSESGVRSIKKLYPLFEVMEREDVVLQIHGEVVDPEVDIFDREARFIERKLQPLVECFPNLRIVLEHLSTREGVEFVQARGPQVAATITAHHLRFNRNWMLTGGIRPHFYCLPVLKRETHRQALVEAATSGSPKFFFGSDSAPHPQEKKECACGCAGCFTAPIALALLAELFEEVERLERLEDFVSRFGAEFYRLPLNREQITLMKQPWRVPERYGEAVPLLAGEPLSWSISSSRASSSFSNASNS